MANARTIQTTLLGALVEPANGLEHCWPFAHSNSPHDPRSQDSRLEEINGSHLFTIDPVAEVVAVRVDKEDCLVLDVLGKDLTQPACVN